MMILRLLTICCLTALHAGWLTTAEAQTQSVRIGEYRFSIPVDMRLERVTTEAETSWPVVVDWDLQGRLLVIESGGVSKPIVEHNKQLLHRVVRLEDHNDDGIFDKRTLVAKDLPFMEGILSIGNDLLVSAPPNIYRLIDADGDGVCEDREVWFDGQTVTGCANDLHGPYLGRDGWVYWCKGAFAEQQHALIDGRQLTTSAAHIFRRRLSGGPIEPVMTGGMDNPVEVAFTPAGERFFTSTFLHRPAPGIRDGIAHAIYGGLYGKDHHVINTHVQTGPLMPVTVELGAAAPSGLICLDSTRLLPTAQPGEATLVAALFNLQKVTAHSLTAEGASFVSRNTDLVVADRIDFHPTDILEDADGSLLIVDTGGWYNLCCPSSRVDQKTAAGGIYRLSRRSSAELGQPRAQPQTTSRFSQRLTDRRPWVARQAQLELLSLPAASMPAVVAQLTEVLSDSQASIDQRLKCLWGLCTLGSEQALAAIAQQLMTAVPEAAPGDSQLLQAACHAMALHRFQSAKQPLEQLLIHSDSQVRRTAAEAMGRLGDSQSARPLLASLEMSRSPDRHWEHSVTYALIELKSSEAVLKWLTAKDFRQELNAPQKMVAMTAIEQLGAAERLPAELLLDGLTAENADYRRTASEILARHPQWAGDYRGAMSELFSRARDDSQSAAATALTRLVTGWRDTAPVLQLTTAWLSAPGEASLSQQRLLRELMAGFANSPLPAAWDQPLASWLREAQPTTRQELAQVLARLDLSESPAITQELLARAREAAGLEAALRFLAALPAGARCQDRQLESFLLQGLASESSLPAGEADPAVSIQALAMQALQRVKLSSPTGQELLESLEDQSPRGLPIAIEALSRIGDDQLDSQMLTVLRQLTTARTLSEDQLLNLYRNRSAALKEAAAEAVASLTRASSDIEQQVDQMLSRLTPGDPVRGLQLFRSNKTACSGCHRLGYVGGEIGPDLTRIGSTRTRRALLEAVLFPSARLEQSYQPTKIMTHDGQVYNGLITKHLSPTQFEMQLTADKALVLSTEDVAEQQASQLSIMPSGLAELLTPEELSDLLSILESAK